MAIFCRCSNGYVRACISDPQDVYSQPDDSVTASEMSNSDHDFFSFLLIVIFTLVLVTTIAIFVILFIKRWQRRTRFFAHARLNENVDEITNPIFDFTATESDEIAVPVTNVTNNDDKSFLNPLYESMYSSGKGLLPKKSNDDDDDLKNELL